MKDSKVIYPRFGSTGDDDFAFNKRRYGIRNMAYCVGAIAAIAAAIFIWLKPVAIGPQAVRASLAGTAENIQPIDQTPGISPLELMVRHGKNLPIEYWSDPF